MSYNFHIKVSESSPEARVIRELAASEKISPEQAVNRLITEGAHLHLKENSALEMWGAFSGPEDSALMDEIVSETYQSRLLDQPRVPKA